MAPQLQLLPPIPPRVGLYVRPGWNDHLVIQQLIVEGRAPTGIVFDSRFGHRHEELIEAAADARLDGVLDSGAQELWTPVGRTLTGLDRTPWAWVAGEGAEALAGEAGRRLVREIAERATTVAVGSVLAPTHYLRGGVTDPALAIDIQLARWLRDELNVRGRDDMRIYFRMAAPAATLGSPAARMALRAQLQGLDVDAIWLRLHPFGTSSAGPHALRRYLEICYDLQSAGFPLVAERTGTVGLALMSFNAVGGIECGVTIGERFDALRLFKTSTGTPFATPGFVYLPSMDTFVSRAEARELLARRATKGAVGCRDANCCRRGPDDMVRDPRRHGMFQRIREVEEIGSTPPQRRPDRFVGEVTNAGNLALRLSSAHPTLDKARRRLDSWRGTLSGLPPDIVPKDAPIPAVGRRLNGLSDGSVLRPLASPKRP